MGPDQGRSPAAYFRPQRRVTGRWAGVKGRYFVCFFLTLEAGCRIFQVRMAVCFFCHKELGLEGKVPFSELCPHCGMDAHVCRNCHFYDPGRANNCREPMAEKVRDVEARNHCEYFQLGDQAAGSGANVSQAKAALEELFKKK